MRRASGLRLVRLAASATLAAGAFATAGAEESEAPALSNEHLALEFDAATGSLTSVRNHLTGETYAVSGDAFSIEALEFTAAFTDFSLVSTEATATKFSARYASAAVAVEAVWTLGVGDHFAEKRLTATPANDCGVTRVTVSEPIFSSPGLRLVRYGNPDFGWIGAYVRAKHGKEYPRPPGLEPMQVFFGRTERGGLFTGMEMAYDASRLEGGAVHLGYAPHLKVRAGEPLACEALYLGLYRRYAGDAAAAEWGPMDAEALVAMAGEGGFDGGAAAGLSGATQEGRTEAASPAMWPLPSESRAMTAMTAAILGPPRHGLMAFACGWHSEMDQDAYASDEELEGDLRSLEFLAALGLDGVTDSHPWGGETEKMAALRDGDRYELDGRVRRFVEHARGLGLKVTQWPTMNNTHPWRPYGGPFRADKADWLRGVEGEAVGNAGDYMFRQRLANCFAAEPFYQWLEGIAIDDALGTGLYDSWCIDGDFWGTGAYFNTTLPVTCFAADHMHLPGDANYACQRQLDRMIGEVRRRYPDIYVVMCRPPMDLGIWAQRNVDACFTLIESGTGGSNLVGGDEIRTASRIRVHHHFFPHWLDQSLLFPSFGNPKRVPEWPSGHIDFIMLSALSSSPNLLLYLPTKTGIPEADKAEIRRWLSWGRENEALLRVRRDLPDWPAPGRVDGSAHIVDEAGIVFLFNSGATALEGSFRLTEDAVGIAGRGRYRIVQEYPVSDRTAEASYGDLVRWETPAATAVTLRIAPIR